MQLSKLCCTSDIWGDDLHKYMQMISKHIMMIFSFNFFLGACTKHSCVKV